MTRETVAPTIEEIFDGGPDPHQVLRHPAFATMTLSHVQGGPLALFGSDVGSLGCVRIEIRRAELHRNLNRDWVNPRADTVVAVEMTYAQFAEFITSAGRASGVPVTLVRAPTMPAVGVPEIKPLETKQETFRREIREATEKRIARLLKEIERFQGLIDRGKPPMKTMREIAITLKRLAEQLPGALEFVVESAEEALEVATANARIEVEAFVHSKAQSLGLQSLREMNAEASFGAGALEKPRES
jgi:hypothetical protein